MVWVDFSKDCGYLDEDVYESLTSRYSEVGKMLGSMANHPENFIPKGYRISDEIFTYESDTD